MTLAIVSGGSRGIGLEIAARLAAAGWQVAILGRHPDHVSAAVQSLRDNEPAPIGLTADVCSLPEVQRAVEVAAILASQPPLLLVHAAGTFGPIASVAKASPQEWVDTLTTNLTGAFYLSHCVLPGMLAANWGRLIFLSSRAASGPPSGLTTAYTVSKAALNRFTSELATELRGTGVTANALHPGDVRTDMWRIIRDKLHTEPHPHPLNAWIDRVGSGGGDSPRLAADLVMWIIDHPRVNGEFILPTLLPT